MFNQFLIICGQIIYIRYICAIFIFFMRSSLHANINFMLCLKSNSLLKFSSKFLGLGILHFLNLVNIIFLFIVKLVVQFLQTGFVFVVSIG